MENVTKTPVSSRSGAPLVRGTRQHRKGSVPEIKDLPSYNLQQTLQRRRGSLPISFSPLTKPRSSRTLMTPPVFTLEKGPIRKYTTWNGTVRGDTRVEREYDSAGLPGSETASWILEAEVKSCCDSISTVFCNSDLGVKDEEPNAPSTEYFYARRDSIKQWLADMKWESDTTKTAK